MNRHLSRPRHRCQHFQYFGQFIEIFWKHLFTLHMVQIGSDPSRSGSVKLMLTGSRSTNADKSIPQQWKYQYGLNQQRHYTSVDIFGMFWYIFRERESQITDKSWEAENKTDTTRHHTSQKSHLETMKPGNKVDATRAGKRGDSLTEIRACIQNKEIQEKSVGSMSRLF